MTETLAQILDKATLEKLKPILQAMMGQSPSGRNMWGVTPEETFVGKLQAQRGLPIEQQLAMPTTMDDPAMGFAGTTVGKLGPKVAEFAATLKKTGGLEDLSLAVRNDGALEVQHIAVPKGARKQGLGTAAMEKISQFADESGLRVVLTPALKDDKFGTTSRNRLVDFYKRFGFVENKGRNKDFAISDGMYREPKSGRTE
jgi:GNAT superfamily N-acetyltransferase